MSQSDKPHDTQYLQMPAGQPMSDRPVSPGTAQISKATHIVFKVDNKSEKIQVNDTIVIGRKADPNDTVDFDLGPFGAFQSGVSRRHSAISLIDNALYIEDLGSTNGTRINGAQLTAKRKYRLRDGDEVEFARLRLIVRFENPEN